MTTSGVSRVATRAGDVLTVGAVALTAAAVAVAARYQRNGAGLAVAALLLLCLAVPLVAAAIVRSQPRNAVAWLLAGAGLGLPLAAGSALYAHAGYSASPPLAGTRWAAWLDGWPWTFALTAVPLLGLLLFPDGRRPSGRLRPLLWVCLLVLALQLVSEIFGTHLLDFPDRPNPTALPGTLGDVAEGLGASIVAVPVLTTVNAWLLHRRRRGADNHSSLALASRAGWAIAVSWWLCGVAIVVTDDSNAALPAEALALVALAVACWLAIHRYGLFDARQVITRAFLYGSLSVCVAAVYLVVAAGTTWLVSGSVARPLGVVLSVLAALPLRARLQAGANRLVYGDCDDPHAALDRLGRRLEAVATSSEVLPVVVHTVREALRLPYVRLDVSGTAASAGVRGPGGTERFPLIFAGESLGELTVDLRDANTPLTSAERGLLATIARQAAAAGYAASQAQTFEQVVVHDASPDSVLELPAAAEVAAYRIAMEAMTNSVRHARASWTTVTISMKDDLELEIADDGVGIQPGVRQGVGLASMRERAAELGGLCEISTRSPTGTLVRAVIPIARR